MSSPNSAPTAMRLRQRRFTAPCSLDSAEARRVSLVPHIHDLTGRRGGAPAGRKGVGAEMGAGGTTLALPQVPSGARRGPRSAGARDARLRRLSAAAPRRRGTDPLPSWERSLRTGASLPVLAYPRARSCRSLHAVPATKASVSGDSDGAAEAEADGDSLGESVSDSDESERAARPSGPVSRRPSSDFVIRYNRVSLRGQEAEAAARASARTRAAYETLTTLFLPRWRLHRRLAQRQQERYVARTALDEERRRLSCTRREAVDLIASVLQHRLTTLLPYGVAQLRHAAVRIQRCYRAHSSAVDAVVELNYRQLRQHEERRYWARVVIEREDAMQRQAEARAAALLASHEAAQDDVSLWRGARRKSTQPGMPVELDVYNYFLVGPLPERLVRTELRKAVVAALQQRLVQGRQSSWMTPAAPQGGRALPYQPSAARPPVASLVAPRSTRLLPTMLPHETLVAVLDNVCFLASQFRNDPMLRSHLRGRSERIRSYSSV